MRELEQARSAALFATPLLSHIWADDAELNPVLRDRGPASAFRSPSTCAGSRFREPAASAWARNRR
jgi:hypothetical protein